MRLTLICDRNREKRICKIAISPGSHPLWHKNVFTNREADETEKSTKAPDLDVIIFFHLTSSCHFAQIIAEPLSLSRFF